MKRPLWKIYLKNTCFLGKVPHKESNFNWLKKKEEVMKKEKEKEERDREKEKEKRRRKVFKQRLGAGWGVEISTEPSCLT